MRMVEKVVNCERRSRSMADVVVAKRSVHGI